MKNPGSKVTAAELPQAEPAACSVLLKSKQPCGGRALLFYDTAPPMLRNKRQKTRRHYLCDEHSHLVFLLRATGERVFWMDGTEVNTVEKILLETLPQ